MPISHKHKCIYIHIPKAAGRSMRRALVIPDDKEFLAGKISQEDKVKYDLDLKYVWWNHLPMPALRQFIPEEAFARYFKFSFVRNPWDRMISFHSYFKDVGGYESFEDWIVNGSFSFSKTATPGVEGLKLQVDYIFDAQGRLMVDFVGKIENLTQDWKVVCNKLGIRSRLPCVLPSKHGHYSNYYTSRTKEIIGEAFKKDIETFGYAFEKPPRFYGLYRKKLYAYAMIDKVPNRLRVWANKRFPFVYSGLRKLKAKITGLLSGR